MIEDRSLLLYGESDLQTKHLQLKTGTPNEEPQPKTLTSNINFALNIEKDLCITLFTIFLILTKQYSFLSMN